MIVTGPAGGDVDLLLITHNMALPTVVNGDPLSPRGRVIFMTLWVIGALLVGFMLWRRRR